MNSSPEWKHYLHWTLYLFGNIYEGYGLVQFTFYLTRGIVSLCT
jgi:hypothetical protein